MDLPQRAFICDRVTFMFKFWQGFCVFVIVRGIGSLVQITHFVPNFPASPIRSLVRVQDWVFFIILREFKWRLTF